MFDVDKKGFKIFASVCRIVVGAVFVFSGVVKSIDPWGTALKIGEYFSAFGLEMFAWSAPALAIGQCALELALGLMILSGVWRKLASFVTMMFMAFFTILTLIIAVWNPVDDCGCFGDALKMSNWLTFVKNAVLMPMAVIVWIQARGSKSAALKSGETILAVIFIVGSLMLNVYSWLYLPPVSLFEYRRGTNLRSDVLCSACMERSVVLVYEDVNNGNIEEFAVTDTTWYDASRWRYVETRTPYDDVPQKLHEYDFSVISDGADIAPDIVYSQGDTYIIMVRDAEKLTGACRKRIDNFVGGLTDDMLQNVIFVEGYDDDNYSGGGTVDLDGRDVRKAGMKRKVMARILRADTGMAVVVNGVIADILPCRGMWSKAVSREIIKSEFEN